MGLNFNSKPMHRLVSGMETRHQQIKKPDNKSTTLFAKYDLNGDNKITVDELVKAGYSLKDAQTFANAIYATERNVNKWFMLDKDANGERSEIEYARWLEHNTNYQHMSGDLTNEEFSRNRTAMLNYTNVISETESNLTPLELFNKNLNGFDASNLKGWIDFWINDPNTMRGTKIHAEENMGRKLTEEETKLLYDAAQIQTNNWLFKPKFSLYERCNPDAYTRLITDDQAISCCSGDITPPPDADRNSCSMLFSAINLNSVNDAQEVKTRLAWAAFKTIPKEQTDKMTDEEYAQYQQQWFKMKNMTAAEYRELLKPENAKQREEFEQNSNMTIKQIVDYIDIIESTTGKDFDSEDWEITQNQFYKQIRPKMNGTYKEEGLLDNKTRSDIPENRQALLKYLEENNLLLDGFKEKSTN